MIRVMLLAMFVVFGVATASDYQDFDGRPNSQGIRYLESYTPLGHVPSAKSVGRGTQLDAMPASMMRRPSTGDEDHVARAWHASVRSKFHKAYQGAGQPRIAVFWNRKFDDQLSQWHTNKRTIRSNERTVHRSAKLTSKSKRWQHETTVDSRGNETEYYQRLVSTANRGDDMGSTPAEFGFSAGFVSILINHSVKVLDRATIMRLTQRNQAHQTGVTQVSDHQKIETDALVGYADYLAEIVYSANSNTELGVEFLVTVKEVKTGRIVAMFRSDATPRDLPDPKTHWVATAHGFSQQTMVYHATPKEVGEQLAYETMEAWSHALR